MGYVLAIDLGTTNVAAAVLSAEDRRPAVVELSNARATMPSVVFLAADGQLVVGDAAARRGAEEPLRVAREFKRRLGDPVPVVVANAPLSVPTLLASLARHVISVVADREGSPPAKVVFTHPANWGRWRLDQLADVARLSEVDDFMLLPEPVGAAIHFASRDRVAEGGLVGVYDLGGGTFDATILRRTGDGYEVVGEPGGLERTGGMDFDRAIMSRVLELEGIRTDALSFEDPAQRHAVNELRDGCVAAKEALSVDTHTVLRLPAALGAAELRMTRAELEALLRPFLSETMQVFHDTISAASIRPDQLASILLAGGSSQIPLVGEMLSSTFGRPVHVDVHPKYTAAMGATIEGLRHLRLSRTEPPPGPTTYRFRRADADPPPRSSSGRPGEGGRSGGGAPRAEQSAGRGARPGSAGSSRRAAGTSTGHGAGSHGAPRPVSAAQPRSRRWLWQTAPWSPRSIMLIVVGAVAAAGLGTAVGLLLRLL